MESRLLRVPPLCTWSFAIGTVFCLVIGYVGSGEPLRRDRIRSRTSQGWFTGLIMAPRATGLWPPAIFIQESPLREGELNGQALQQLAGQGFAAFAYRSSRSAPRAVADIMKDCPGAVAAGARTMKALYVIEHPDETERLREVFRQEGLISVCVVCVVDHWPAGSGPPGPGRIEAGPATQPGDRGHLRGKLVVVRGEEWTSEDEGRLQMFHRSFGERAVELQLLHYGGLARGGDHIALYRRIGELGARSLDLPGRPAAGNPSPSMDRAQWSHLGWGFLALLGATCLLRAARLGLVRSTASVWGAVAVLTLVASAGVGVVCTVVSDTAVGEWSSGAAGMFLIDADERADWNWLLSEGRMPPPRVSLLVEQTKLARRALKALYGHLEPELYRRYLLSASLGGDLETDWRWRRLLWDSLVQHMRAAESPEVGAQIVRRVISERMSLSDGTHPSVYAMWTEGAVARDELPRLHLAALRAVGIASRVNPAGQMEIWARDGWVVTPEVNLRLKEL
ncbi:MAG: hypothetical protein NTV51_11150 [Verrucomicrobia bacterium]|nr:hypothetical protein [Verrucomicrobiota bacterium]